MANEYLLRTPTSTGNRRTFTWAGWVKRLNPGQRDWIFNTRNQAGTGDFFAFDILASSDNDVLRVNDSANTDDTNLKTTPSRRDPSSWMHLVLSIDTTKGIEQDRVNIYANGVQISNFTVGNYPTQNALMMVNSLNGMNIGTAIDGSGNPIHSFDGEMFDIFFIDGQALTPDVFGFYKEGKGYQSSGTTQATDFRPGQWVPKAPRTIKTEINRRGGFGVNGFYLSMNDSSNFGADFHCAPNSIIKLKGEDLPQPRNGAPTTTDAYVSQLRSDPYAANLVLAVPGISTSTSANLITNGTFDSDISDWTTVQATTSWQSGVLRIVPNSGVNGAVYQSITTEVGKRYTVSMEVVAAGAAFARLHVGTSTDIDSADKYTYTNGTAAQNVGAGKYSASFTPTTTTTIIWLEVGGGQQTQVDFDNVVVKQEDVPRDYSADIKGSGTNKTLTANGNAGVGYELGNYYGSAIDFYGTSTSDYLEIAHSEDFNFGSGDFTIECWRYLKSFNTGGTYLAKYDGSSPGSDFFFAGQGSGVESFYWYDSGTQNISSSSIASLNQWDHIAACREGNKISLFVNGVCVAVNTNVTASFNNNTEVVRSGASAAGSYTMDGYIQDLRVYKGVAKYKGGFDVPKPFTPVGIESWRRVTDNCKNNFPTLSPLEGNGTLSDGNLTVTAGGIQSRNITFATPGNGKWYAEFRTGNVQSGTWEVLGIHPINKISGPDRAYAANGQFWNGSAWGNFGTAWSNGDIIGIAYNQDDNQISFYLNGTLQGSTQSYSSSESHYFVARGNTGSIFNCNFGQNPTFSGNTTAGTFTDANGKGLFKYQPPAGYLALCEDNLPTPAIADPSEHFKTVLYEGDGTSGRSINVGFKPDLIWLKNRSGTNWHLWYDSVRGPGNSLYSNVFNDEDYYESLLSFDSNGFSVSHNSNVNSVNISGGDIVAWCWKAGGPAVTNNDGSVASQISVNQAAGFSVVSWTSDGTSLTVGHGLNKVPSLIIQKQRDVDANWTVYHKDLAATEIVKLDTDGDKETSSDFANTRPTSSVLSSNTTGISGRKIIAYCWAEVEGFSKFGSYEGNGNADGPFVYCGFKPAWVMVKNIDDTSGRNWGIQDSSRQPINPCDKHLKADSNEVENSGLAGSTYQIDLLSNGFKVRNNTGIWNENNDTIIFAAFAESPFQTANAK